MIIKSKDIRGCYVEFKTDNGATHSLLTDYGIEFKQELTFKLNILFTELMKSIPQV